MLIKVVNDLQAIGAGINGLADLVEIVMTAIQKLKNGGNDEQNQDVEGCC